MFSSFFLLKLFYLLIFFLLILEKFVQHVLIGFISLLCVYLYI